MFIFNQLKGFFLTVRSESEMAKESEHDYINFKSGFQIIFTDGLINLNLGLTNKYCSNVLNLDLTNK